MLNRCEIRSKIKFYYVKERIQKEVLKSSSVFKVVIFLSLAQQGCASCL